jgi:hypothetical protein
MLGHQRIKVINGGAEREVGGKCRISRVDSLISPGSRETSSQPLLTPATPANLPVGRAPRLASKPTINKASAAQRHFPLSFRPLLVRRRGPVINRSRASAPPLLRHTDPPRREGRAIFPHFMMSGRQGQAVDRTLRLQCRVGCGAGRGRVLEAPECAHTASPEYRDNWHYGLIRLLNFSCPSRPANSLRPSSHSGYECP